MIKTVEVWCCGTAADHEVGNTDVTVYASEEDCLAANECSRVAPELCAPRKLTVTFDTPVRRHDRIKGVVSLERVR